MSGKFRGKILCDANDIMIPKEGSCCTTPIRRNNRRVFILRKMIIVHLKKKAVADVESVLKEDISS